MHEMCAAGRGARHGRTRTERCHPSTEAERIRTRKSEVGTRDADRDASNLHRVVGRFRTVIRVMWPGSAGPDARRTANTRIGDRGEAVGSYISFLTIFNN